jgi:aconitate hydratase
MLRNYDDPSQDPVFSQITTLDLGEVVPSISGPKRPHDRVSVSKAHKDFKTCLTNKVSSFYNSIYFV